MNAKTFIRNHTNGATERKLIEGVSNYVRYQKFSILDYTAERLAQDVSNGTVSKWHGIGRTTVNKLKEALESENYL